MAFLTIVVIAVVLTLTRIIKSVVTGQAPVTLELRNTPREKTQPTRRWYTHTSQLTQFMPPPEKYKSEIGSQPAMCQVHVLVHTSHYSRLEKPTIPLAPQDYHVYIARSICHLSYARQTQVNWKKKKKRKEDKERKEKTK